MSEDKREFRDKFRNLLTEVETPGGTHLESVDDEVWQWIESKKAEWQREAIEDAIVKIRNSGHYYSAEINKILQQIEGKYLTSPSKEASNE